MLDVARPGPTDRVLQTHAGSAELSWKQNLSGRSINQGADPLLGGRPQARAAQRAGPWRRQSEPCDGDSGRMPTSGARADLKHKSEFSR